VKNAEGSVGQYKLVVDTGSMPLTGNNGQVTELTPSPQSGLASATLAPTAGPVQYFPIQVPAYHVGFLNVTGSPPPYEEVEAFDGQGRSLGGTYSNGYHFTMPDGPQMVYLRVEGASGPSSVDIVVRPPFSIPTLPSASTLLPTNPQGNGFIEDDLNQ